MNKPKLVPDKKLHEKVDEVLRLMRVTCKHDFSIEADDWNEQALFRCCLCGGTVTVNPFDKPLNYNK